MSSNENQPDFDVKSVFDEFVGTHIEYDAGLRYFDKRMIDAEEDLRQKIGITKTGFDAEIAEMYEEDLSRLWEHEGHVATVTGRVYLAIPDLKNVIPGEWAETAEALTESPEEVGYSYFVEDVELRSHGIEVLPVFDETRDAVQDVRMAYVFALADDQFDRPILRVFPGELLEHHYELPTAIEAGKRIHRGWPEEARLIDLIIKPEKIDDGLSMRLAMVARRLQSRLMEDEQFRAVAELYINTQLDFKPDLPYLMAISRSFTLFEGGDIEDATAKYDWSHFTLTEPLSIMAYAPRFLFTRTQESIESTIMASSYSEESPDEPEYFRATATAIDYFRPMFTKRSLGSRALMGEHLIAATHDDLRRHRWMLSAPSQEFAPLAAIPHKKERPELINGRPKEIALMEMGLERLQDIYKHVREAKKTIYRTIADAEEASRAIIQSYIAPSLEGLLNGKTEMEFSGTGVLKPNAEVATLPVDDDTQGSIFALRVDYDNSKIPLEKGDWITGLPYAISPFVQERRDNDNETEGYSVYPSILVKLPVDEKSLMNWQGVDVVTVEVQQYIVVPLDGSAIIKNKPVQLFHQSREAMQAVQTHYHGKDIIKKIDRLQKALLSEDASSFVQLIDVDIIRAVGRSVTKLAEEGLNPSTAMRALEAMLTNRVIRLNGAVYRQTEEGVYIPEDMGDEDDPTGLVVLDVRNDIFGKRPVLVCQFAGSLILYVPIDEISELHF